MSMKCLAIRRNRDDPMLVGLNKLGHLHVVGVAGGDVRAMGVSPEVDGAFTSYRWPEIPIRNEGDISIYFLNLLNARLPV